MSALIELTAEVTRERWRPREADSDFVIAEAQSESIAEGIVVIGNAPRGDLIGGLTYRLFGRWDEDRKDKYTGRVEKQFKFTQYVKAEPHTRYGLVNYLAKYASGIGPVIANRLFDEFGTEAVKVLREHPEKAVAVANRGGRQLLSLEKAEQAAAALRAMGQNEDTKIELATMFTGRGFPHSLADQVIKVWGVLAPKRIARDPFSLLVRRLPGCGFARCDRLYNDLGLPPGRLKRQMICLWHSLRTSSDGSTWFAAEQCKQILEQSVSGVRVNFIRAVTLGLRSRWLARYTDSGDKMWLAEFTKAENERIVAERLAMLLDDPEPLPKFTTKIGQGMTERLEKIPGACVADEWLSGLEWDSTGKPTDAIIEKVRLGRSRGICQFCSRELTHPISVVLGYGPICAAKHSLPWTEVMEEAELIFEGLTKEESEVSHA